MSSNVPVLTNRTLVTTGVQNTTNFDRVAPPSIYAQLAGAALQIWLRNLNERRLGMTLGTDETIR
ncbi:MAG: hypothetical protein ACI9R3_006524 [Verrucomicrobiales bacterium]|jgi:hypothetical protein